MDTERLYGALNPYLEEDYEQALTDLLEDVLHHEPKIDIDWALRCARLNAATTPSG
jgi:hypothetical protein